MEILYKADSHLYFNPAVLQSENFCDLTIQCEDGSFNGLQSVLAMASTFLKELLMQSQILNNDFNPQVNPLLVISIPDVSVRQMNLVFTLFLTGKLEDLNTDDVHLLKRAWKLLKIDRFNIQSLEVLMNDAKEDFKAHKEDEKTDSKHNINAEKHNNIPNILLPNQSVAQLMKKQAHVNKESDQVDVNKESDQVIIETKMKSESNESKEWISYWEANSEESPAFDTENIECQYCDKMFPQVDVLVSHLKMHLVEIDNNDVHLKCTAKGCDYQPIIVSNLNKGNEKRVHKLKQLVTIEDHFRAKHTKEPKQECLECQKKFFSIKALTYHMKQHKMPSKFFCHACDHFIKKSQFTKHTTNDCTNSIKFKLSCEICGKQFSGKTNLDVHKQIHKKEKPYKCDHCNKTFLQKGNCRSHMIKKHPSHPK